MARLKVSEVKESPKGMHTLLGMSSDPCKYQQHKDVVSNTLVGVEIELENVGHLNLNNPTFRSYWNVVEDGSLRDNGLEFVFSRPFTGCDLISALDIFDKTVASHKEDIQISERTSVHIHVDIRDLTFHQLLKFVSLYAVFEEALFRISGGIGRRSGIFATSLSNAEGFISHLGRVGQDPDPFSTQRILSKFTKYSACNLAATSKYGSLEFRNHEGTCDTSRILKWINILLLLRKSSVENETPVQEIFNTISVSGAESVLRDVFKEYSDEMIYPDLEFDMFNGLRLAQDIIHSQELFGGIEVPKSEDLTDTIFSNFYKKTNPRRFTERFKKYINLPEELDRGLDVGRIRGFGIPRAHAWAVLDDPERPQVEVTYTINDASSTVIINV